MLILTLLHFNDVGKNTPTIQTKQLTQSGRTRNGVLWVHRALAFGAALPIPEIIYSAIFAECPNVIFFFGPLYSVY